MKNSSTKNKDNPFEEIFKNRIKVPEWKDFSLLDDLGDECNDRISALLDEFAVKYVEISVIEREAWAVKVLNAEYMDKIYSIIKSRLSKIKG